MSAFRLKMWHAIVPLTALVSVASLAQTRTDSPLSADSYYSHTTLQEMWKRATNELPPSSELMTFLTKNLSTAATKPPGGLIPVGGPAAPGSPASTLDMKLLPVASPTADLAREMHRRAALLELLLTGLQAYREPRLTDNVTPADVQAREQQSADRQAFAASAHLELFVAYAAFYLEGESKTEKCRSFDRALEHARFLGFRPDRRSGAAPTATVRESHRALHAQAWSFYAGGFATSIPQDVCDREPVVTRSEDEQRARGRVDFTISGRVSGAMDKQLAALAGPQQVFKKLEDESEVAVPTRAIFQLKRAVEDSAALYQFVQSDALLLETGSRETGVTSLLERVEAQRGRLQELKQKSEQGGMELDEGARAARAVLDKYNVTIESIVATLKEAAALPGLDVALRSSLAPCSALPTTLTIENSETFASGLGDCMRRVADAYTSLKGRVGSDAEYVLFTQRTTDLSSAYIAYFRSQPR